MENNNQNEAAKQQNANNNPTGAHRHHRHRGHRGGKHHGGKKENAAQINEIKANEAPAAPAENKGNNGSPAENPAAQGQKKHGRNRNRRHKSSQNRQPAVDTVAEELSLSDLRARIVLKAADGSIPAESKSEEPVEVSIPKTNDVKAEEAIPVFESSLIGEDILTPAPDIPTPIGKTDDRIEVIGVRFRTSGKMYYFDPNGIAVEKGQSVIVETTRGPEFGEVCLKNAYVNKKDTVLPLRPLVRIATEADVAHNAENRKKEEEALVACRERIAHHKLDMKLIDAQYAFDNSKLLFYFSAEGRVDFRDLVKDLASIFHTRIELRQIGIRDEARMLGGLGVCGRTLCCSTFLPDFTQVSINMAKEQNLSLNSSKISGVCGRLMCCLHYESEVYAEEIRKTPSNDSIVKTEDGIGTVIASNPLAGTVRVILKDTNDNTPKQYHRDQVTVIGKEKRGGQKNAEKSE